MLRGPASLSAWAAAILQPLVEASDVDDRADVFAPGDQGATVPGLEVEMDPLAVDGGDRGGGDDGVAGGRGGEVLELEAVADRRLARARDAAGSPPEQPLP